MYKEGVNVLDHVVVVLETCDVGGGGESTVQCPQPLSANHVHDVMVAEVCSALGMEKR